MSAEEKAVDAQIAEFGSAREEVFARIESQRQSFNYLVTLSTAVLAFIGSALTPSGVRFDVRLVMFTPLLAAPLAFIFFDNELVIWTLGRYIREELAPRVSAAVGRDVLVMEATRGGFLSGGIGAVHLALSVGRWLLFLLPIGLPLWYGFHIHAERGWPYVPPFRVLAVLDALVLALLCLAIVAALLLRFRVWRAGAPAGAAGAAPSAAPRPGAQRTSGTSGAQKARGRRA
jgi:hypothetical protein